VSAEVVPESVSAEVIDLVRVNLAGRDIGVDSLITQLVISRRLAHGATP